MIWRRRYTVFVLLLACIASSTDTGSPCPVHDCDGDRWIAEYDCDDNDPSPEASQPTAWYPDTDGDGHGVLPGVGYCDDPGAGWTDNADDCDDTDPDGGVWPCSG